MVKLDTKIGSLKLKNPVLVASGTFGYGEEFSELYELSKLGAVVTKGISIKPRKGNPMPRMVETPSGLINSIGLENVGIETFLEDKLPFLQEERATVVVNVFGESIDEYYELVKILDSVDGVHAIELNISCPNVKAGGMHFGASATSARALTESVRKATELPLWVKLSPMVSDIAEIAKAVEEAGADAISLINTISAMAIDVATRKPKIANVVGGLSGPAIKPVALKLVWQAFNAVKIPVIGIGGIMNVTDALEFMVAGASAIQIGTANFVSPNTAMDIISNLETYAKENSLTNISDIVGSLRV
jgi:dihydroorotate dehydrogenase (NAD+) catalytic subunit